MLAGLGATRVHPAVADPDRDERRPAWARQVRSAAAAPATQDEQAVRTVNLELILDLSGSMARDIGGGETRMEAAKRVMNDVIDALPEREGVNVGFRIYGHLGDNTEAGRDVSCQSSDLVVPIQGVNKPALRDQVAAAQPIGWTPIALSLQRAGGDFQPAKGWQTISCSSPTVKRRAVATLAWSRSR